MKYNIPEFTNFDLFENPLFVDLSRFNEVDYIKPVIEDSNLNKLGSTEKNDGYTRSGLQMWMSEIGGQTYKKPKNIFGENAGVQPNCILQDILLYKEKNSWKMGFCWISPTYRYFSDKNWKTYIISDRTNCSIPSSFYFTKALKIDQYISVNTLQPSTMVVLGKTLFKNKPKEKDLLHLIASMYDKNFYMNYRKDKLTFNVRGETISNITNQTFVCCLFVYVYFKHAKHLVEYQQGNVIKQVALTHNENVGLDDEGREIGLYNPIYAAKENRENYDEDLGLNYGYPLYKIKNGTFTMKDFEAVNNAEIMAYIVKTHYPDDAAFVKAMGGKVIDKDVIKTKRGGVHHYELISVNVKAESGASQFKYKNWKYLRMINPSTKEIHIEAVSPKCTTCKEAFPYRTKEKSLENWTIVEIA